VRIDEKKERDKMFIFGGRAISLEGIRLIKFPEHDPTEEYTEPFILYDDGFELYVSYELARDLIKYLAASQYRDGGGRLFIYGDFAVSLEGLRLVTEMAGGCAGNYAILQYRNGSEHQTPPGVVGAIAALFDQCKLSQSHARA
jgi:hypothetical protein